MYSLASSTWDEQEIKAVMELLNSGTLTMGAEVAKFERDFASYIGTKYAVMFNSGSSANLGMIAGIKYMKDSQLKIGDRIIVPAVSWSTTYYPINQCGFVIDFVDINKKTLNLDLDLVASAITPDTKAIFAVNLLGNPAELIKLKKLADENNLILIEDNCESLGAELNGIRTGSFGLAGSHSFFFSHHICTMEGGMVTTNSLELAEAMVSIRAHGWTRGLPQTNSVFNKSNNNWDDLYRFVLPGYNLRPLEISGAIGQIQLSKFPIFLNARRENAMHFVNLLSESDSYEIQYENGRSSWFGFSIVLKNKLKGKRKELLRLFADKNIDTRPIVAGNFTLNPVMKYLDFKVSSELTNSNIIHNEGFFIGNHHFDVSSELNGIFDLLKKFEMEYSS